MCRHFDLGTAANQYVPKGPRVEKAIDTNVR